MCLRTRNTEWVGIHFALHMVLPFVRPRFVVMKRNLVRHTLIVEEDQDKARLDRHVHGGPVTSHTHTQLGYTAGWSTNAWKQHAA